MPLNKKTPSGDIFIPWGLFIGTLRKLNFIGPPRKSVVGSFDYRHSPGNPTIRLIGRGHSAWRRVEEIESVHLQISERTLQGRRRSAGGQSCLVEDDRGPLRGFAPVEVSHWILLVTPPSHYASRKGKVLLLVTLLGVKNCRVNIDPAAILSRNYYLSLNSSWPVPRNLPAKN
jgi:hypothetical protein